MSAPTRQFVEIPDPDDSLAHVLGTAVEALVGSDVAGAEAALRPVWGWTTDVYPVPELPELAETKTWPKGTGGRTRRIPNHTKAEIYEAASYTCVYCGRRTVHPNVLRLVHRRFPDALPFAPGGHWAQKLTHPVWWDISTSVDHVTAAAMGGQDLDDNLVCACWRCQWQKVHRPLEAFGWPTRTYTSQWRGLTEHYEALWHAAGRPSGQDAAWRQTFRIRDSS